MSKLGMLFIFIFSTRGFVREYEKYRNRKILAHMKLDSYKKQRKSKSEKKRSEKSADKTNAADR